MVIRANNNTIAILFVRRRHHGNGWLDNFIRLALDVFQDTGDLTFARFRFLLRRKLELGLREAIAYAPGRRTIMFAYDRKDALCE